jgi:hypothetical protein
MAGFVSGYARRIYESLKSADARDRAWYAASALVGLVALGTIWLHHYPVGIDLPQHANLFRLWYATWRGPIEYRVLYHFDWFTPYLLIYMIGGLLTGLFGSFFAIKLMLTLGIFGTPLMMRRWLKSIGGDPRLALYGYVIAFGYLYIWGFFSNLLALPLLLAYLAEFELQGERPGVREILKTTGIGLALFFTHGITFVPAVVSAGLQLLRGRFPFVAFRKGLHLIPLALLAGAWMLGHRAPLQGTSLVWFMDLNRLVSLWSGLFWPFADLGWEHVGLAGMGAFLLAARPRFAFEARRWVPLLVAVVGFAVLPEMLASIWQFGNRFLVFVQALAPGVIQPRHSGRVGKVFPYVSAALVLAALALLNVRLSAHNQELYGLRQLSERVEPESDIQNVVAVFGYTGKTFGWNEVGQTPGWLTAEQGGILDNDSAGGHYHVPVQRADMPWITRYRYAFLKGTSDDVEAYVRPRFDHPRLVGQVDDWFLYEQPPLQGGDVEALRCAQAAGELRSNRAFDMGPLSIGGERFATGFGTHVPSLIRVRLLHPGSVLEGSYGIDDSGYKTVRARFRIRDNSGKVLLSSGPISYGPAQRFSVPVAGQRELLLEVLAEGSIIGGHVDWADLRTR